MSQPPDHDAPHRLHLPGRPLYALQEAVFPQSHHPVRALVLRMKGDVSVLPLGRGLAFGTGGLARLDTAHNIFPLQKWRVHAGIADLCLVLRGRGVFTLTIGSEAAETRQEIRLGDEPLVLDLSDREGVLLHLAFAARGEGVLHGLTWATSTPPRRLPQLALVITTFHREAEARRGIDRFAGRAARLADHLDLMVIDNGQTLEPVSLPRIRVIPNRNLGGAGGFARGMAEARAIGATHCLFMDDDAALDTNALERIWTFLAHARDPRVAIAGALMSAEFPERLWENGATFDGVFQPLSRGRDLTDRDDLFTTEIHSLHPVRNAYGGFWCYAFALDAAIHVPFPFFVRGDDTSFCIANGFVQVTLPGVLCHQDVDFTEKETPQTLYLDLRSNLIHLVTLPQSRRLLRALALSARFFGRSLMQHQVDSLRALNHAVEDFLAGPEALEPDLATRRKVLADERRHEVWQEAPVPEARRRFNPDRRLVRLAFALGLNGLLLPGFAAWGDRAVLPQRQRGIVRPCWGAAEVVYVSTDGQRIMRLRLNRAAVLREGLRMARNLGVMVLRFPRLRRDWAAGYARMTRPEWWAQFR